MSLDTAKTVLKDIVAPAVSFALAGKGAKDAYQARKQYQSNAQRGGQVVRELRRDIPQVGSEVELSAQSMAKAAHLGTKGAWANLGAAVTNGVQAGGALVVNSLKLVGHTVPIVVSNGLFLSSSVVQAGAHVVNTYVSGKNCFKALKEARNPEDRAQKEYSKARAQDQAIKTISSLVQAVGAGASAITLNPLPAVLTSISGGVVSFASNYFATKKQAQIAKDNPTSLPVQLAEIRAHPSIISPIHIARSAALSIDSASPSAQPGSSSKELVSSPTTATPLRSSSSALSPSSVAAEDPLLDEERDFPVALDPVLEEEEEPLATPQGVSPEQREQRQVDPAEGVGV